MNKKRITVICFLIILTFLISHSQATAYSATRGVELGDTIRLAYKGVFKNGTIFDQNQNAVFKNLQYGNYIDGFVTNVLGMKIGESKTFEVPPSQGYTQKGHKLYGLTLIFTVKILGVQGYTSAAPQSSGPNILSQTFTVIAWIGGIILAPIVGYRGYEYFKNSTVINKKINVCSVCGDKSDGICASCGFPYCRSDFRKGCPNCHANTFKPKS